MTEQEGVIKYRLDYQHSALAKSIDVTEINAWRCILYRLQLIGRQADRYQGLGYGNISRRLAPDGEAFLITGTQTGHLPSLTRQHFALVDQASAQQNRLQAKGPSQPSSEALTHAVLYQQDPAIQAVIHVHSPTLWQHTMSLSLPHTAADIPYGTPAMAAAVEQILNSGKLTSSLFTMLGHQDGVIAFGSSIEAATLTLLGGLSRAIRIDLLQEEA